MSDKKWIEISIDGNYLTITSQSHIRHEFGTSISNDKEFIAKNGFKLESCNCPQYRENENRLFVRGDSTNRDIDQLWIDDIGLQKIIFAVNEYNDYFGSPEKCYGIYRLPEELFEL
jgi:hypothetical protein